MESPRSYNTFGVFKASSFQYTVPDLIADSFIVCLQPSLSISSLRSKRKALCKRLVTCISEIVSHPPASDTLLRLAETRIASAVGLGPSSRLTGSLAFFGITTSTGKACPVTPYSGQKVCSSVLLHYRYLNLGLKILYLALLALQVILGLGNRPKAERFAYAASIWLFGFLALYLVINTLYLTAMALCPMQAKIKVALDAGQSLASVLISGTYAPIVSGFGRFWLSDV